MNSGRPSATPDTQQQTRLLNNRLRLILETVPLDRQRDTVLTIAAELDVDALQCAAALLHLLQTDPADPSQRPKKSTATQPAIKMIRYRLALGSQHQLTLEQLKQVLVEESGVDKNNIVNVSIRDTYTLIDLPDAMPQDIYQHLKSVEINHHKLDIKRVKIRKKRHGNHPRAKSRNDKPENAAITEAGPQRRARA